MTGPYTMSRKGALFFIHLPHSLSLLKKMGGKWSNIKRERMGWGGRDKENTSNYGNNDTKYMICSTQF